MSATPHTPGPWIHAHSPGGNAGRPKITTVAWCEDFVIGLPSDYPGGNYRDGDPSGDPEADARLIAAAPELYEVVRALVHIAQHGPFDPSPLDENSPLMDAARATLAKVAGNQA